MKSIILFILVLFSTAICFAAQSNYTESLTISTYYPAPYGVYRDLQARKSLAVGNFTASEVQSLNSGDIMTSGVIIVGNGTTAVNGAFRFNGTGFEGYYGGKWNPLGGSGGNPLVNSLHTESQCVAAGGEVVSIGAAYPICRYNAGGCPTGWNRYNNWSTTVGGQTVPNFGPTACASQSCLNTCSGAKVTGHSWANTLPEVWAYHHYIGAVQGSAPQPIGCCEVYALGAYQQGCVSGGSKADGSYFEQLDVSGAPASATITQVGCY